MTLIGLCIFCAGLMYYIAADLFKAYDRRRKHASAAIVIMFLSMAMALYNLAQMIGEP